MPIIVMVFDHSERVWRDQQGRQFIVETKAGMAGIKHCATCGQPSPFGMVEVNPGTVSEGYGYGWPKLGGAQYCLDCVEVFLPVNLCLLPA